MVLNIIYVLIEICGEFKFCWNREAKILRSIQEYMTFEMHSFNRSEVRNGFVGPKQVFPCKYVAGFEADVMGEGCLQCTMFLVAGCTLSSMQLPELALNTKPIMCRNNHACHQ